jgi:F-type H+-transporting ATPase subunit delta
MTEVEKIPVVLDASMVQVGEVYAHALLAEGQKHGHVDRLVEQLSQFGKVLNDLPKLRMALESPKFPYENKAALIDKSLQGRADKSLMDFLKILARRGRFDCFPAVERAARGIQDEMTGRVRAVITSATELSDEMKERLEKQFSTMLGKKVLASVKVEPAIIGGVVVRVGDTVYDISVANKLKQLKSKAIKGVSDSIRQSIERFATEV